MERSSNPLLPLLGGAGVGWVRGGLTSDFVKGCDFVVSQDKAKMLTL
ncbi:MAG: hypothetical protein F6K35_06680 [Okeania sp. SIO2H7]|nr:hypothetical protein [Okeania sp. SIO2H7]